MDFGIERQTAVSGQALDLGDGAALPRALRRGGRGASAGRDG